MVRYQQYHNHNDMMYQLLFFVLFAESFYLILITGCAYGFDYLYA